MEPGAAIAGGTAVIVAVIVVAGVLAPTIFPLANDLNAPNETFTASGVGSPNPCQNATGYALRNGSVTGVNRVYNGTTIRTTNGTGYTYFSNNNSIKCVDGGLAANLTYSVDYNYRSSQFINNAGTRTILNAVPVLATILIVVVVAALALNQIRGGGGRGGGF
jgi:hypothetical protein